MATILIVDDELAIAESLGLILEEEGFAVACAANGRQGMESALEIKPDIIILDFIMPLMGGAEMGHQVRANSELHKTKIVMNSSLTEAVVRAEFNGYDVFLRKPYTIFTLLDVISELIGGK